MYGISSMIQLGKKVWKLNVDSNVYIIDCGEKVVVDCGPRAYFVDVKKELSSVVNLEEIKKVILTHIHYDHCGNVDLFPNTTIYAHKDEITDFKKMPSIAFSLPFPIITLLKLKLTDIAEIADFLKKNNIEIIEVPGHTKGSIALIHSKEKILFSGDCLFENGIGRYDLPNSVPAKMEKSLAKLKKLDYKILAPGHDY